MGPGSGFVQGRLRGARRPADGQPAGAQPRRVRQSPPLAFGRKRREPLSRKRSRRADARVRRDWRVAPASRSAERRSGCARFVRAQHPPTARAPPQRGGAEHTKTQGIGAELTGSSHWMFRNCTRQLIHPEVACQFPASPAGTAAAASALSLRTRRRSGLVSNSR